MSAGVLPRTVTGDYSLDDFLDAGERERPDDPAETDDSSAADESEAESKSVSGTESDPEPDADTPDDGADAESHDEPSVDADAAEVDPAEEEVLDPESVDPAQPTYDWSPDGMECVACGDTTSTRWRQDGAYVCADCKEW